MSLTLPAILRPYNQSVIARHVGESRARVNTWARGKSVPEIRHLPKLAEILRISVADLTEIIAAESPQGDSAQSVPSV